MSRDSGSRRDGEDAQRLSAEGTAERPEGHRPNTPTTTPSIQGETSELLKRLRRGAGTSHGLINPDGPEAADTIERLQALSPSVENGEETAWLIECPKHHPGEYYLLTNIPLPGTKGGTLKNGRRALHHEWTGDVHAATKFPTKADADAEIAGDPDLVAIEHLFGLRLPTPKQEWRDIATAKREIDNEILGFGMYYFKPCRFVCVWNGVEWYAGWGNAIQPTHWMPLPDPPATAIESRAYRGDE